MQKLDKEYLGQIKRYNVLALDVATNCGYYSIYGYGTWHFPRNESAAARKLGNEYGQHKAFREKLISFIKEYDIKVIAAEDVIFGHFIDFRKLCELRGIMLEVCETMNIPYVLFKPSDIKKFATGNGNASKQLMIEYAIKKWKIDPEKDDNAADSVHIFHYFCKRYGL